MQACATLSLVRLPFPKIAMFSVKYGEWHFVTVKLHNIDYRDKI